MIASSNGDSMLTVARLPGPRAMFAAASLMALWSGCAVRAPDSFPSAPLKVESVNVGAVVRHYDLDRDGIADYREQIGAAGRIEALRFVGQTLDRQIPWPPTDPVPHLLIIVDSVPFEIVEQMHRQGRFRLFAPPSRVMSPFPVMTDVSLTEFFRMAPVPGVEAQYLDGDRLTDGTTSYLTKRNMPWLARVDYGLAPIGHAFAYTDPVPWFGHELARIRERGLGALTKGRDYVGYCVGTSALGSVLGRNGHHLALVRLDRLCQSLVHDTRGRIQITLMSDHGHDLRPSRWVSLAGALRELGYRLGSRLARDVDLVIPEWGMVSCAALHTRNPAVVAADLTGVEGVELVTYLESDPDAVVVLSRDGRARIERTATGYRYRVDFGDPLALLPVLDQLGGLQPDGRGGSASDEQWHDATINHDYPDALHRLWRSFHGLIQNQPDILVSMADGYHTGSESMTRRLQMAATHGNLRARSTNGFVMSTVDRLPPSVRMESLAESLRERRLSPPLPADADTRD